MKIKFLGTGAAEGVPAVFCNCPLCEEVRKRGEQEYHTRSQVVIDDKLSVDYPPDAYYHSLRFGVDLKALEFILVTHSHMDHFYAHDFILRGYKYCNEIEKPLRIYGNAEVKKVFEECTRRELREDVKDNLIVTELRPFEPISVREYIIFPLKAQHSKTEEALLFLIEKQGKTYLHLTDTGRLPEESLNALQAYLTSQGKILNFVAFDCTFLYRTAGEISRHMGLGDNAVMREEFLRRKIANEDTVYAITHYSHNNNPLKEILLQAEKDYGVRAAFDGVEFEV